MDSLPGNSHAGKEKETKKLERVTMSDVTRLKQPLGRRFLNTFIAGDPKQVTRDVIFDVLIPAARDLLTDVATRAVEQLIHGDSRTSRARANRPSGTNGYVSYNRFSSSTGSSILNRREEERRPLTREIPSVDDLVIGTRAEAEVIIDRMFDIVNRWEQASVHDLYELVGITGEPIHQNWGWTNMEGANFRRVGTGQYLLILPKIEHLKK